MCWFGTMPRLIIAKAELMRLILNDNSGHFKKPPLNPLVDLLTMGLSTLEGEKWAKRRRLITPAFHHEKLQVISLIRIPSSFVLFPSINYLFELLFVPSDSRLIDSGTLLALFVGVFYRTMVKRESEKNNKSRPEL